LDLWPLSALLPKSWSVALEGSPASGGTPISGPPQTADLSCGGWWSITMELWLNSLAASHAYRGMLASARVSSSYFVVPVLDALQPWPAGGPGSSVPIGFGDAAAFSDGALFTGDRITAALAANAYAPAYPAPPAAPTVAQIQITAGGALNGGEYFTLIGPSGCPRLHMIGRVLNVSGNVYTVNFTPPLRENYASGTAVEFDRPACTMTFDKTALAQAWPRYTPGFVASPVVRLVEANFD
jgi:hypothetical protein